MKLIKFKSLLFVILFASSCGKNKVIEKPPLVIPTVDVENLNINLPNLPTYNEGNLKSDESYDYLDFYEISDFHGAINYEKHSDYDYIGLSKLATYFNNKRNNNPGGTILLSSGDMFQGSAESNLTHGYIVNYSMKYMGFDAMAIGNHEFDWTDEWIKKNAELTYNNYKIPYLGANIIDKNTQELPDFLQKSTIISRGEYKIGVIGTIGEDLCSSILASNVSNYEFKAEEDIVASEAQNLRNNGCDLVIWLAHQGLDKITSVAGVDAIFGGHAHINDISTTDIPMLATANYGKSVAHISFKIDKNNKENISLDGCNIESFYSGSLFSLEENSDINSIIAQYNSEIDAIKNIKLGRTSTELKIEEELKNICTQTMFDKAIEFSKTNSDIQQDKIIGAFHNVVGGIRANIQPGEITYGKVFVPFPFDNEIVLYKVKGTNLVSPSYNALYNMGSLGCTRTFNSRNDIKLSEYYYLVLTDFIALSETYCKNIGVFPDIEESDLIRTGYTVRDCVAEKIYYLDNIDASQFSNSIQKYQSIPMDF